MLDAHRISFRQIGQVGLGREEEHHFFIQVSPSMCPQRSSIGFSTSDVNRSMHIAQLS